MSYEELGSRILEALPLAEGVGAAESSIVKVTCPEVFVEILRDIQRFLEFDLSSVHTFHYLHFSIILRYIAKMIPRL